MELGDRTFRSPCDDKAPSRSTALRGCIGTVRGGTAAGGHHHFRQSLPGPFRGGAQGWAGRGTERTVPSGNPHHQRNEGEDQWGKTEILRLGERPGRFFKQRRGGLQGGPLGVCRYQRAGRRGACASEKRMAIRRRIHGKRMERGIPPSRRSVLGCSPEKSEDLPCRRSWRRECRRHII